MSEHINETPLLEVKHLRKLFPGETDIPVRRKDIYQGCG